MGASWKDSKNGVGKSRMPGAPAAHSYLEGSSLRRAVTETGRYAQNVGLFFFKGTCLFVLKGRVIEGGSSFLQLLPQIATKASTEPGASSVAGTETHRPSSTASPKPFT